MAALRDDVTIGSIDGTAVQHVMLDETSQIGIFVRLRGETVTAATAEVIINRGSQSVTLSATIASGTVTAPITAANLVSLNATMLDSITAWFEVTVTDGSTTHRARYEMLIVVTDREGRFSVDYLELEQQLPQMKLAAAIPRDQTNFYPQLRIALRNRRNWLNRQQANVKDYLLTNMDELKELAECDCLAMISGVMSSQENGQARTLADRSMAWTKRAETLQAAINATVKAGTKSWGESGDARVKSGIKPVATWSGNNGGIGGPL